ncbi:MAG: hypothetical protein ACTH1Q_10230, partial [Levilactobacillus brevis]
RLLSGNSSLKSVCRVNNITDLGIEKCLIVRVLLRQIPTSFIDINDKSTVIVTVGLSFLFRNKYQTFMQNLVGAAGGKKVWVYGLENIMNTK